MVATVKSHATSIDVIPTNAQLGAEIRGVDLTMSLEKTVAHEISDALETYGVIFFRGQDIPMNLQEEFISFYGPPNKLNPNANTERLGNGNFFDVSNVDGEGKIMKQGDDRRQYLLANLLWHSDMSMRQPPARVTSLSARVLPEEDSPNTEYVDTRVAYDLLSDEMKKLVNGLTVEHSVMASREKAGFTNFSSEWRKQMPPSQHPLVRTHVSGRKSLYIGAHASHIVGWPIEKGKRLLEDLVEIASQPHLIYRHEWQVHDFVVWDNSCTMHRARRYDDQKYRRELRWCSSRELEPV